MKPGQHNLPVVQPYMKPFEENVTVEKFVLKSVVKEDGKTGDKQAQQKPVAKSVVKEAGKTGDKPAQEKPVVNFVIKDAVKSGVKPGQEYVLQTSQKHENYIPNGALAKRTRSRALNMNE